LARILVIFFCLGLCTSETKILFPNNDVSKRALTYDKLVNVLKDSDVFLSDSDEYILSNEKSDKRGNSHRAYQHTYMGVPVFGSFLRLHFDSDDILKSLSLNASHNFNLDISPKFTSGQILETANQMTGRRDVAVTDPSLCILIKKDEPILCYYLKLVGFEEAQRFFFDANTSEIVDAHNLIHYDGPTTGSGVNLLEEQVDHLEIYEGDGFGSMGGDLVTPNLICEQYCWDYGDCDNQNYNSCEIDPQQGQCPDGYLEDCNGECFHGWYMQFPGVGNGFCNDPWIEYAESDIATGEFNLVDESNVDLGMIFTINSYGGFYEDLSYVNSTTNEFSSVDGALSHASGVSAHDYQRKTQDYMWNYHGYAGIDGEGKRVVSVINYSGATGISQNNAFYNAALDVLTYGIGSGNYRPFCAAQDIVTHEYGHGFTAHTSGLIYRNQSGAINESISDVFGFFVEAEYQDDWDWVQGEDVHINGNASRSFINPPAFGDPDHVDHPYFVPYNNNPVWSNDFGGVHTNLGIPNKILYLVIQGDTHYGIEVSPFDSDFDTSRIIASNIWFSWNAFYLDFEDDFEIGREKMLQVSYDLYPNNANYYQTIANAWASTGIGDEFHLGDVNADTILNIQDVIIILQYILGNYDLSEFQFFTIDTNQDQTIDILDIVEVINGILYGG
jgi:Zn-dependent metalloprotease